MLAQFLALAALLALCALPTFAGMADDPKDTADKPVVVLDTNQGQIALELDPEKAPISVNNFLEYVDAGFYDGTVFHRVIPGFMIQGGGYTADYQEKKTRDPIKNESGNGLSNARGTIAMARTDDPNSATAQFFINVVDNKRLDTYRGGYAVFGKVIDGMDVVDKIVNVPTGSNRAFPSDVPKETVTIKSAKRRKSS